MSSFARTDTSLLGRWWWTVDRWTLLSLIALMGFGAVLMLAASPAAAERIGLKSFQLASRQIVLLPFAAAVLIAVSLATPRWVRRIACVGLLGSVVLLIVTLFVGPEIKGATRWISLGGLSIQPSEFAKPCFAVVAAWMFSLKSEETGVPGAKIAVALWLMMVALLLLQPDVGQAVLLTAIWGTQVFLAGLPLAWIAVLAVVGAGGLVAAYFALPHVSARVDSFFDPAAGDRYQINRSIEAFMNGGLLGRGPGEGTVKAQLPDAHSDFIFAVAGEELGLIACLLILGLFAFVVLRGFARLLQENSLFVLLAASGLLVQFGLQAFINMASTLHLMPTKGMTLPFLSYGGSSLMALALGMGMLLALTRRRVGGEAKP
ncbi:putative lipid II flippase FtsW [Pelagibius sp.]|uniref:putative lipid II flippase FtsW n=1 Tax=Pelagibius sp. TaxID=1931238 RepID=UPI003B5001F8